MTLVLSKCTCVGVVMETLKSGNIHHRINHHISQGTQPSLSTTETSNNSLLLGLPSIKPRRTQCKEDIIGRDGLEIQCSHQHRYHRGRLWRGGGTSVHLGVACARLGRWRRRWSSRQCLWGWSQGWGIDGGWWLGRLEVGEMLQKH